METLTKKEKLDYFHEHLDNCPRCPLSGTRTHMVFGEGNPEAPVVFIGEAPGKEEDIQGKPFVGRSGQLLSEMIFEVFHWDRKNYYITNILKCRPTVDQKMVKDRPPEKEEIEKCLPILLEQLKIIKPEIIVAIGSSSAKTLLDAKLGITSLRGKWYDFQGIPLMATYHPSYLLRNGGKSSEQYKTMMSDLILVRTKLENNQRRMNTDTHGS